MRKMSARKYAQMERKPTKDNWKILRCVSNQGLITARPLTNVVIRVCPSVKRGLPVRITMFWYSVRLLSFRDVPAHYSISFKLMPSLVRAWSGLDEKFLGKKNRKTLRTTEKANKSCSVHGLNTCQWNIEEFLFNSKFARFFLIEYITASI